ncbi:MAG TPA: helix-turn-helix transcriptional regulator [Solirubrobacterales bacterium]
MPPPTDAQLGAAIRLLRKARGWSIETLGAKADVHWTSISKIERGEQSPTWGTLCAITEALEVDLGDLAKLAAKQRRTAAKRQVRRKSRR